MKSRMMNNKIVTPNMPATKHAKKLRGKYCRQVSKRLEDDWMRDKRAGRLKEEIDKEHVDKKGSFRWLREGLLKYDGERMIIAAQDQALTTRATLHILYPQTDP